MAKNLPKKFDRYSLTIIPLLVLYAKKIKKLKELKL